MKILKIATYISIFFFSQWSYSSMDRPKSEEDFAQLPPYCKAQQWAGYQNIDPSAAKLWQARLGDGYPHIHHYCFGLFDLNNAHKIPNKADRTFLLEQAIGEMRYVQKAAPPTFVLQPKISYDIGQILEELDNFSGAMQAYYQSIKLNPKLPRPYAALSDLFKKQNNTKEALAILEQGLKYKPKSKALLKRLAQLSNENK